MDDGRLTPCCRFTDQATVESDPSVYNCDTCAVQDAMEALDAENLEAWGVFQQVCTRFVMDGHALGLVLHRLTRDRDEEAYGDLVTRLSLLYDIYYPPQKPAKGSRGTRTQHPNHG